MPLSRFALPVLLAWGLLLGAAASTPRLVTPELPVGGYHLLKPGEIRSFQVKVAEGGVTWTLTGGGQMAVEPPGGPTAEYRAPRAGGNTSLLTATSTLDPTQRVVYTLQVEPNAAPKAPAKVDLLPFLTYVPEERNQGTCANCYAWAATGAIEMELFRRYGIRDRLSIQYFNSIYQPRLPEDSPDPCTGNSFSTVLEHYQRHGRMVPWSNPNADFQERGSKSGVPRPPREAVGLLPHYNVDHLDSTQVVTKLWSQEEIIEELKQVLARNKALIFKIDGHYSLIVGYNAQDPDPAKHRWKVLDTVGSVAVTPLMVRPMAMRGLEYNALAGPEAYRYQFDYIDNLQLKLQAPGLPVSSIAPSRVDLVAGQPLRLVASVGGRPPVTYQWLKDGHDLPGQTGSILALPAAVRMDEGLYSVRVTNASGEAPSDPVRVTVADTGLPRLTVLPVAATLGAGTSRTFRATLTGVMDPRVTWTLVGGGKLLDPTANPVTYCAPASTQGAVLRAQAVADPALVFTVPLTVKTMDFNGDGVVDVLDLAILAQSFRSMSGDPHFLDAVDLNGNGMVDEEDAIAFLAHLDAIP